MKCPEKWMQSTTLLARKIFWSVEPGEIQAHRRPVRDEEGSGVRVVGHSVTDHVRHESDRVCAPKTHGGHLIVLAVESSGVDEGLDSVLGGAIGQTKSVRPRRPQHLNFWKKLSRWKGQLHVNKSCRSPPCKWRKCYAKGTVTGTRA